MTNLFNKRVILILMILLSSTSYVALCQNKSITCKDLKSGIFHSYPKNTADHYISIREEEYQYETNIKTGDTTLWQIKWLNDCSYTLKYVSGSSKNVNEETIKFLKKHKLAYEIVNITAEYYTFKGYVDKASNLPLLTDTMWLSEKMHVTNNEIYKYIPNPQTLKKDHFSDTSQYAVLYVYRPGKLTNSLSNYLIYFDENILCVAKNKSGYIFKILKEGQFNLKSRLYKDESAIKIDVKFGNSYYIKSMVNWGMFKGLKNYKLEMSLINPAEGKIEFAEVNL